MNVFPVSDSYQTCPSTGEVGGPSDTITEFPVDNGGRFVLQLVLQKALLDILKPAIFNLGNIYISQLFPSCRLGVRFHFAFYPVFHVIGHLWKADNPFAVVFIAFKKTR